MNSAELRYLTEVDGENHFAFGAVLEKDDGTEEGVGVARFIRLPGEQKVAEPAVTVVDAYQGKGVGRLLLRRLTSAARERGVEKFRCDFLVNNDKIRNLLDDLFESRCVVCEGAETVTMDFELPEPSVGERLRSVLAGSELYRAFSSVAAGGLSTIFGWSAPHVTGRAVDDYSQGEVK